MTEGLAVVDGRRLPSETWARFTLLVLASVATLLSVAESMWFGLFRSEGQDTLFRCEALDPLDVQGLRSACMVESARGRVGWVLAVGAGLAVVTVLVVAVAGSLRRRDLTAAAARPALRAAADAAFVGLRRTPQLVTRRGGLIAMARADGALRPYVEIGSNWAVLAVVDPPRARAVLAHEAHHLRSRDVYPSRVSWWTAPVIGIFAATGLMVFGLGGGAALVDAAVRTVAMVAVVLAGRASVLRAREFAADIAAGALEPEATSRWLAMRGAAAEQWWRRMWAVHPSVAERAATLADPARWTLTWQDGLVVGVAGAATGSVFAELLRSWRISVDTPYWAELVGWLASGAVIGAWATTMVLRAVLAARAGSAPVRLEVFAATLVVGVLVGVTLFDTAFQLPIDPLPGSWTEFVGWLFLAMGLVGTVALVRGLVEWWLDRAPAGIRGRAIGVPIWVGAVLTALVLGVLATFARQLHDIGSAGLTPAEDVLDQAVGAAIVVAASYPAGLSLLLVVLVVLALMVLPSRRGTAAPGWLTRTGQDRPEGAVRPPVLVRGCLVAGVVAGLLGIGAFVVFDALRPDPVNWHDAVVLALVPPLLIGGLGAMAGVAVAASVRTVELPRAVLAAAVASLVAAVGVAVIQADLAALTFVLRQVAAIAVFGTVVLAGVLVSVARDRRGGAAAAVVLVGMLGTTAVVAGLVTAHPSAYRDAGNLAQAIAPVETIASEAVKACAEGRGDRTALAAATTALTKLRAPAATPVTAQIKDVHSAVVAVLAQCADAQASAASHGGTTLDPADLVGFDGKIATMNRLLAALSSG